MFIYQLRIGSTFIIPYMPGHLWTLRNFELPHHFYFDSDTGLKASSGRLLEVELINDNVAAGFFDEGFVTQLSLF